VSLRKGEQLIERWNGWVQEQEPLDQFEYLGVLQVRDELEVWLQISGDPRAMERVDALDHDLAMLTMEDGRFAVQFSSQAGAGWSWNRMSSDPAAQEYLVKDWLA